MQTTRNREETLTASKHIVTCHFDVFFSHLLSCGRSHLLICPFQSSVCRRDITCFSSTAQGVCCERGGGWRPGIFQRHAGDATSLQI